MTMTLKKPSKFITYLDMNNLYWRRLSDYLGFDINSISEKSSMGYFLEVDLEYPDELNELHNDYPLAPEKLVVSSD